MFRSALSVLALGALVSACAGAPPSTVQFLDMTGEVARDVALYQTWVAKDQAANPFPVGLCLKSIEVSVDVSESRKRNGEAGIPLATPAGALALSIFGSSSEEEGHKITVPFVPVYPPVAKAAPKDAAGRGAMVKAWIDKVKARPAGAPRTWAEPPYPGAKPGDPTVAGFSDDESLAAELWRLRAASHLPVYESARSGPMILRPDKVTYTRDFTVKSTGGGKAKISLTGGAGLSAGVERSEAATGKMTIAFVRNQSFDPFACDARSLIGPAKKK